MKKYPWQQIRIHGGKRLSLTWNVTLPDLVMKWDLLLDKMSTPACHRQNISSCDRMLDWCCQCELPQLLRQQEKKKYSAVLHEKKALDVLLHPLQLAGPGTEKESLSNISSASREGSFDLRREAWSIDFDNYSASCIFFSACKLGCNGLLRKMNIYWSRKIDYSISPNWLQMRKWCGWLCFSQKSVNAINSPR